MSHRKPVSANGKVKIFNAATAEVPYTPDQKEFMLETEAFKRDYGRPFPTLSELWMVLYSLGYRKVAGKKSIAEILKRIPGRMKQ